MRRDFAPSREPGEDTAGTIASRTTGGGFPGTDEACSGYLRPVECFGGGRTGGSLDVAATLTAKGNRQDFEVETFAVHGTQDPIVAHDMAHALGRNSGQENAVCVTGSITHTLRAEGADASEDGTGRGTPIVAIPHVDVMPTLRAGAPNGGNGYGARSGDCKDEYIIPVSLSVALRGREGGATAELGDDVAGCLRASSGGGDKPHVLLAFDTTQVTSAANYSNPQPGDPCHPLAAGAHAPAIAYTTKLHNTKSNNAGKLFEERTPCLDANSPAPAPALLTASQVRRLTPMECERLMGFPDGYTRIPNWNGWRKLDDSETPEQCIADGIEVRQNKKTGKWRVKDVDGPRYKALGNSWAVPNVAWIGRRIDTAVKTLKHANDNIKQSTEAAA